MKEKSKQTYGFILAAVLISLSAALYFIHYLFFHDSHHIFLYLVGDIAFVPIEVLLVTVIIHKLLEERDKRAMLRKLNMVIGVFFSEVGTDMLGFFKDFHADGSSADMLITSDWKAEDFCKMQKAIQNIDYKIDVTRGDLCGLQEFVRNKRNFLLVILENPNLLEHDTFTEMLWAVFHFADEVGHRKNIQNLSKNDRDHLAGDIKRAYRLLLRQWLDYLMHLKEDYPYLFSLAIRSNPFNPQAHIEFE